MKAPTLNAQERAFSQTVKHVVEVLAPPTLTEEQSAGHFHAAKPALFHAVEPAHSPAAVDLATPEDIVKAAAAAHAASTAASCANGPKVCVVVGECSKDVESPKHLNGGEHAEASCTYAIISLEGPFWPSCKDGKLPATLAPRQAVEPMRSPEPPCPTPLPETEVGLASPPSPLQGSDCQRTLTHQTPGLKQQRSLEAMGPSRDWGAGPITVANKRGLLQMPRPALALVDALSYQLQL